MTNTAMDRPEENLQEIRHQIESANREYNRSKCNEASRFAISNIVSNVTPNNFSRSRSPRKFSVNSLNSTPAKRSSRFFSVGVGSEFLR